MAAFARRRGHVDPQAMANYPLLPLPTGHTARILDARTPPLRIPPARMPMDMAIGNLRHSAQRIGLMVV
jgi:hypothetical protein